MATAVERTDSTATRRGVSLVSHGLLGVGLVGLAAGLAVNSLLGPLAAEAFQFPISETLRNQMIGLDAVSLLVVAPLAVVAGVLVLRGRVLGQALALGIGAYTAYMFVQYALGPEFGARPGDSQALFPLYLVLFALGWIVAHAAWNGLDPDRLPSDRRRDLAVGLVQMGFPAFRTGWYTPYWLDRLQWGIEERSSDTIVSELQELAVGDRVPDSRDWSAYFHVVELEPERALVLHSIRHVLPPMRSNEFTWAFVLQPDGERATRLLIRARGCMEPRLARVVLGPLISLGDFANASVMLRGIKARAEGRRAVPEKAAA